jgi:transposase
MAKFYRIELTGAEREKLCAMIKKSTAARRKLLHARILLKADQSPDGPGWRDVDIAEALEVGLSTVERTRQKWVEEGMEVALSGRPSKQVYRRKLDGKAEAHLIALACGPAPQGRNRWTLELLGDRLVQLRVVDSICPNTVRQTLKKMNLSLG